MQTRQEMAKLLNESNLLPLAFIGDSVHTLYVREFVLKESLDKMTNYNSKASFFCKASSQAKVVKKILPILSDEEQEIVRRARNAKSKHQAKNASTADYCYATAFEALIGFLYLNERHERLQEILQMSMEGEDYVS